jgi:DNA-directed RNA polymerase specialized sigma24 family protein
VTLHGPMVLHVCRQVLRDRHHAEDAFQAVFLVLARKALSIRGPNLLGTWLYGVSIRTARTMQVRDARQRREETDSLRRKGLGSNGQVPPEDRPKMLAPHIDTVQTRLSGP